MYWLATAHLVVDCVIVSLLCSIDECVRRIVSEDIPLVFSV